ncbi:MAG: hypothetical protein RLZZ324_988 [Candidatus Parcubacteria bacterium]|jgi:hypothetical protein
MCCTLAPAVLSSTIVYAAEVERQGKRVHVLGYQNTAQNLPSRAESTLHELLGVLSQTGYDARKRSQKDADGFDPFARGNAMILPIPALPGTLTPENLVSTERCGHVLDDMAEAIRPRTRATLGGPLIGSYSNHSKVVVFEHDIYTVVLADDARDVTAALASVPEEKRPQLNAEVFNAYAEWYPRWPILVFCFNNAEAARSKPVLCWYEPVKMFAQSLFIPGLDSHSGAVPPVHHAVQRDHTIVVSAAGMTGGAEVLYRDESGITGPVRDLLAPRVYGERLDERGNNGDWRVELAKLRKGTLDIRESLPPGYAG